MKLLASLPLGSITTPGGYLPSGGSDVASATSPIESLISNALVVLTVVAGLAFVIWFLLGGLNWITAGGKKDAIEKAKGMMTNGAIGMIIIVVSYSIVWIIGKALGLDILHPANVLGSLIKVN